MVSRCFEHGRMSSGVRKGTWKRLAVAVWFWTGRCGTTAFRMPHVRSAPNEQRLRFMRRTDSSLFSQDQRKAENSPFGRKMIKSDSNPALMKHDDAGDNNSRKRLATTDPLLQRRDRALLALHSSLGMDMVEAMNLLEAFPSLYRDCPSLSTRILYLREELNLSKTKIQNLLSVHPSMMVRVLLDDPENNLSSTVELLQTELQLPLEEIVKKRLYGLDRMELRPKLAFLKRELQMSTDDLVRMIRRSTAIMMLDFHTVQDHVEFLVEGPVGEGLGMILRRGLSTDRVEGSKEKKNIVIERVKELLIKYPDAVASDIRPAVEYLTSVGCDPVILGRIAYRRPQLFQYEVASLQEQLQFFANSLRLPLGQDSADSETKKPTKTVVDLLAVVPDVFTQSRALNLEPKFRYFRDILGFDQSELQLIFVERLQILALSLENNIVPKVEYLRRPLKEGGAGVSAEGLRRLVLDCPQSLREPLSERIQKRCNEAVAAGCTIPDDLPPRFLTMTDRMWAPWVKAGFDQSKLDEARAALKAERAKK